jgi:hypothetical protein
MSDQHEFTEPGAREGFADVLAGAKSLLSARDGDVHDNAPIDQNSSIGSTHYDRPGDRAVSVRIPLIVNDEPGEPQQCASAPA